MFDRNEELFGIEVTDLSVEDIVDRAIAEDGSVINTLNPHSFVTQRSDRDFRDALAASDYVVPDGEGVVLANNLLCDKPLSKLSGFDVFLECSRRANTSNFGVFFLGSTQAVLEKVQLRFLYDFPNAPVSVFSPPFRREFTRSDVVEMVERIQASGARFVFVGLTAPKQEKLIAQLRLEVKNRIFVGIGAVFDFYAGTVQRPSLFWQKIKLEWAVRFLREPVRLFRRNFVSTPVFIVIMLSKAFSRLFRL
jgi:N-acetylglucosaminyldiphosphoundecaprenol N-acetyl-beta-D-mannosaminyltransferase